MSIKDEIIAGMRLLDEDRVLEKAREAIAADTNRLDLLSWMNRGMEEVGKLYESREYYIIELIMSEIIYKQVLNLDGFKQWERKENEEPAAVIVLGTVNGDNHDIGKNIFASMSEASNIEVYDLGVDVPNQMFIEMIRKKKPDILALSGILTSAAEEMRKLIALIEEEGLRKDIKILAGGPALSEHHAQYVKADAWVMDASEGVEICKEWIEEKRDNGR